MKAGEVKAMRDDEITVELKRLREKLHTLRTQSLSEKIEDNSQFGDIRRDIARLKTESHRRVLEGAGACCPMGRGCHESGDGGVEVVRMELIAAWHCAGAFGRLTEDERDCCQRLEDRRGRERRA